MIPEYDLSKLYPHRKCLSSTQVLDYIKSPPEFYTRWVLGWNGVPGVAMKIGRIFSALYENRKLNYKEELEAVKAPKRFTQIFKSAIAAFPVLKGGHPELALTCKHRGWEFRATLDDYVAKTYDVYENKTGERVWDKERVACSLQLTFQAWVHWKRYGVPPRRIILRWVDCRRHTKTLVSEFRAYRSIKVLQKFEATVDLVIDNLSAGNFTKSIYGW